MNEEEKVKFVNFLKDSFVADKYECELRLSSIELDYLNKKFPQMIISPMENSGTSHKNWFKVKKPK